MRNPNRLFTKLSNRRPGPWTGPESPPPFGYGTASFSAGRLRVASGGSIMPEPAWACLAREVAASGQAFSTGRRFALVALMATVFPAAASGPLIDPPEIPSLTKIVGPPADGNASATTTIQQALDAVRDAGGGRVLIPAGRFFSGPLVIGSKTELHLARDAVLVMSDKETDYPAERNRRPAFISADGAHDIRLSGEGRIEGQGGRWWKVFLDEKARGTKDAPRRPQLVSFSRCERVEVAGISTFDPPNTHYSFKDCREVTIRGIKAIAPDESPNTDALNLSNVRDALIRDCDISTGDDNIVLLCGAARQKGMPEVENIMIRDCRLGFGHGLSIGSYTSGGVRNVTAENIRFDGTTSGIRMKAWRDRGGVVEGIRYRNLTMKNVRFPVSITSYYPKPPAHPSQDQPAKGHALNPVWRDISIENLGVTDSKNSIILWGLPDEPVTALKMKNVTMATQAGALVFHAKGIEFSNVVIRPEKGPVLRCYDAVVQGLEGEECGDEPVKFK